MVVQHNLRAMNSNRMLGLTQSQQAKSSEKLSSGYKINRAADDAAGLSISEKMRKQIRGLTQASLNAQDGISAVQTAEGALHEVQDMLQRMNELAVKAANGTNSEDDRGYIQDEIEQLKTEINRVAETTKFNETYLLKGDATKTGTAYEYIKTETMVTNLAGNDVALYDVCGAKLTPEKTKEAIQRGETLYVGAPTQAGTKAQATDIENNANTYIVTNQALYDINGHEVVEKGAVLAKGDVTNYYTDKNQTQATTAVNDNTKYVAAKKIYNADGTLRYDAGTIIDKDTNPTADIVKYYSTAPTLAAEAVEGKDFLIVEPKLFDKDGNGVAANGLESYFEKNEDGETVYKGGLYDSNKKEIGTVGSKIVDDTELSKFIGTTLSGPGSLSFKLHVGADATDNNQIQLEISAMDAKTLGVDKVSVETEKGALDTIETVKAAIQKISTQRSALGAVQNRLEHTINNLDNVVENTTAAESQIRDTDMATEMVKFSNNNILAQAGQAMLAQSNQANQGVLALLQ